jgi:hypothetical protein
MEVTFDVAGWHGSLSERTAALLAESLRCFALGPTHDFYRDVELLEGAGVNPRWVRGARAMADIIEDTLTARRHGPIPLDPSGLAAEALMQALRLTGPAQADAASEHAVLLRLLRETRPPADVRITV